MDLKFLNFSANLPPLSSMSMSNIEVTPMSVSQTTVENFEDLNETVPMEIVDDGPYTKPRDLSSYEIIKTLGEGGQGRVELAKVKDTGELIALKIVQIKDQDTLNQVNKELSALEQLSVPSCHSFVICYYNHFFDAFNRRMLIEMEYIEGVDLDVWSKQYRDRGNFNALYQNLNFLTVDMCKALAFVHNKGLIHRDIKPANIMITTGNQPKLIDFGLSCNPTLCPTVDVNVSYTCCYGRAGTPIFLPPETIANRVSYFASDIWMLGGTLFKVASGIYAFPMSEPNNIPLVLQTILDSQPYILQTGNFKLDKVVNSSLNKIPENRPTPQTMLSWLP